ncbi:hypothetical protein M3C74_06770 [Micrococcus lylae]|uniref:DUF6707 family protein n=1 Tax=Micrococcus TaxID=1269 RepID=UPI0008A46AF4|nr:MULTISPECIES: DUF6707 family protein [Micrococcus]MCT2007830.1 hypothetical protein [Micrococcus lylae]MCT2071534.1 hypothetical protein [Micrococcus lylae]OFR86497.1 hypothetical protein HMPREF2863_03855 [Micrococcus sp. HMSC067E09]
MATTAGAYLRHLKAQDVSPGDMFLTRRGQTAPPVASLRTMRDDFGTPALVVATLEDGREVKIAYGSVIRVRTDRADQQPQLDTSFSATDAGTPEARIVGVGKRHLDDVELTATCARLSHGLNLRSGAHLEDVLGVAERLYLLHEDNEGALQALGLLTNLPWDGAVGRWKSIQAGLGLASQILREEGDHITAANLGKRLLEADEVPNEPGRAAKVLEVRQRQLNEPQLYDREIARALQTNDPTAELKWRRARWTTLLYLRARGGSETLTETDLQSRIAREVGTVRELARAAERRKG